MSENEAHERPLVVNWGTVGWVLSMLFAGFIAWSSMSERVRLLEEQQKQYATVAQLAQSEQELARQLDKLTDLLCDDPAKAGRRACVERAP
jgi:cell division protein FtsB